MSFRLGYHKLEAKLDLVYTRLDTQDISNWDLPVGGGHHGRSTLMLLCYFLYDSWSRTNFRQLAMFFKFLQVRDNSIFLHCLKVIIVW